MPVGEGGQEQQAIQIEIMIDGVAGHNRASNRGTQKRRHKPAGPWVWNILTILGRSQSYNCGERKITRMCSHIWFCGDAVLAWQVSYLVKPEITSVIHAPWEPTQARDLRESTNAYTDLYPCVDV